MPQTQLPLKSSPQQDIQTLRGALTKRPADQAAPVESLARLKTRLADLKAKSPLFARVALSEHVRRFKTES